MPLIIPGSGLNNLLDKFAALSQEKYNSMSSKELISLILDLKFPLRNTRNIPPNLSTNFHPTSEQMNIQEERNLQEDSLEIELKKLSHAQLINKHKEIATKQAALKKLYDDNEKRKDIARFERAQIWNGSNTAADFSYWAKQDYWTAHEGITLLLNKNPDEVTNYILEKTVVTVPDYEPPFLKSYLENIKLAQRSIEKNINLWSKTTPILFIEWAEGKSLIIPDELKKIVSKYAPTTVSWKNKFEELQKNILEEQKIANESPLETVNQTEKNNLLKTIGALSLILIKVSKGKKYGSNLTPNQSAVFKEITSILDDNDYENNGMRSSAISQRISDGIDLLNKSIK